MSTTTAPAPDFPAIKVRQQATWASGDFGVIGTTLQIVGETLCAAADVRAGERVLDVAAGNGNASLAAARCFADVTAMDYVPELLEQARARAEVDGLSMTTVTADAEDLPFADASFDVALSTYGVMFCPDQERAAQELVRVVRPGGRIGLASWTPAGFVGQLFTTIAAQIPPPAGVDSPMRWGTKGRIRELIGDQAAGIRWDRRHYAFRYRSPEHFIQVFRDFYGPTHMAFAALDDDGRATLHERLVALLERFNTDREGSLVVPAEYLQAVITLK